MLGSKNKCSIADGLDVTRALRLLGKAANQLSLEAGRGSPDRRRVDAVSVLHWNGTGGERTGGREGGPYWGRGVGDGARGKKQRPDPATPVGDAPLCGFSDLRHGWLPTARQAAPL